MIKENAQTQRQENRLGREKSPYLLQHRHNPVDWFAWGDEAFTKARAEQKPIFLSIGYSTCHWCHVMERESFENTRLADYLNQHFVSIKVDREERPDVDRIYMTFVQAMAGQGGWPLNVFLTPDLKPFYGGTYWPPEERYGRPGFLQVLQQVHKAWQDRHEQLTQSAVELHGRLVELVQREPDATTQLTPEVLRQAGRRLKENYDAKYGGWGQAPKFPSPSHPAFLLLYGHFFKDAQAVEMVLHTCERMASGGIYDQLGGGFHRYSVDERWLVPHFEKMLYDNAQLVNLYLDCYLVSGEAGYADVARDILRYVFRDMTHPEGGFFSAEDADSEGKEGKFYTWTRAEMAELLSPEELTVAVRAYGVSAEGNFIDHSDPEPLQNQNVLSLTDTDLSPEEERLLGAAKQKLLEARELRVRPHLDDKVLASWNGLMLGALARAAVVLGDKRYEEAARRNLAFIQAKLWDPATRTLYHRWRADERDQVQLLEAYAFLLSGVVDLYQTTLAPETLDFAIALAQAMIDRFYDYEEGGFWQGSRQAEDLILRVKEDYDGAEPSGNSVAALALLKLAALTDRADFKSAAEKTLQLFSSRMVQLPQAVPYLLRALDFWLHEPHRVVLAEGNDATETHALLQSAHAVYQPRKVVLGTKGPVEPFARIQAAKNGQPTAYVCTGTACQPPTHDPAEVKRLLAK